MHDVAILIITTQNIRYNLAKSVGIQAFVKILDGVVDVFLLCGNASQLITFFYWHLI